MESSSVVQTDNMERNALLVFIVGICCAHAEFHYLGHEFDRTPLGNSIDKASVQLLKEAYDSSSNKNTILSPLGVLTLLSLYSSGAPGPIRDQITRVLTTTNYEEMLNNYSRLSEEYSSYDNNILTLANKVYVSDKFTLKDHFIFTAQTLYNSDVETLNFKNTTSAAANINQWAHTKSNGHIRDPVKKESLGESIAVALFNIVFFQGHWGVPFNASRTVEEPFHLDATRTVQKPMMRLLKSLFYYKSDTLKAKLIELPYKEAGFRMVVFLPDEIDGLPSLLNKVAQHGLLSDVFSLQPARNKIDLHMPKFSIDSEFNLKELLPKVGISDLFSAGASEIVKESPVRVSEAFQKAFIKIDEEGATAGAFTGVIAVPLSGNYKPPPPTEIKVDHPFMFAILKEDKILFVGTQSY